jgi:hypothetical protein
MPTGTPILRLLRIFGIVPIEVLNSSLLVSRCCMYVLLQQQQHVTSLVCKGNESEYFVHGIISVRGSF